jgi:Exopolysaccharide biosynthesis protein YbjH
MTRSRVILHATLSATLLIAGCPLAVAEPSQSSQTGLINMPDAHTEPEGTWRLGFSNANPYGSVWTSISVLPRLELSGRFTRIKGILAFPGQDYGDYKDRAIDIKLQLFRETDTWPALALGVQDTFGTRILGAQYLALSKNIGPFDATLGHGTGRIDGWYGGVRFYPTSAKNIALVAEYDANDYVHDLSSNLSGADKRPKGAAYGVEYKWGWLGTQLSYQKGGVFGATGYVAIPLQSPDFIPKLNEPAPYTEVTTRPTYDEWQQDIKYKNRLAKVLWEDDFTNIAIRSTGPDLHLKLSNARISELSRAVGRVARASALLSPVETKRIFITYTLVELPSVTYEFSDLNQLQRYFNGQITRKELAATVNITYPAGGPANQGYGEGDLFLGLDDDQPGLRTVFNDEGDLISLKRTDSLLNRIKIAPKLDVILNDPSGAFHYNIFLNADYSKNLGNQLFLNSSLSWTLAEDISKISTPLNSSLLPHVRSDIAEYKKDNHLKLSSLLLNKYYHPKERVYARLSAGIYEEMYAGLGGQWLYVPASGNLATDVAIDWVKQRDTKGLLGFNKYSAVTALVSTRYRMPYDTTATVRAGRFLAKDWGARLELKRRFASGYEMGAWYTRTNGNDLNASGNVGKPYFDKGIFLSIPLNTLLTKDTQAVAGFAIAPWTRDVGQMVASPDDLYGLVEKPLVVDVHNRDGLAHFGDVEDNY